MSAQDPQQDKAITSDLHNGNEEEEEEPAYYEEEDVTEEDTKEATENSSELKTEIQAINEFKEERHFRIVTLGRIGTGKAATYFKLAGSDFHERSGDTNYFSRVNFRVDESLFTTNRGVQVKSSSSGASKECRSRTWTWNECMPSNSGMRPGIYGKCVM